MRKILFLLVALLFVSVGNAQAWFIADPRTTDGAASVKIPVYNDSTSALSAGNVVGLDADASTGDNDLYVALVDANDTALVVGVVWPDEIAAKSTGSVVVYGFAECDLDIGGVDENGFICTSAQGSGGLGRTCINNDQAYAIATIDNSGSVQTTCFVTNK